MTSVTQRQLRNDSGELLRRAAAGEIIVVTRNHTPIAQLGPIPTRRAVHADTIHRTFRTAPPVDVDAFTRDMDAVADQTVDDPYGR